MADPSAAEELFSELERRVEEHLGATEPEPVAEAGHLATAEADVIHTIGALSALGSDLADDRGHPVLADLAVWRDLAAGMGLENAARESDELVDALVGGIATEWREQVLAPLDRDDPNACFLAISSAREFDLEALARRRGSPPLSEVRPELRQALLAAIEARPPDEPTRDRWTTQLLDRADAVLAAVDGIEADRAVARIRLVLRDVQWHISCVETTNSWRRRRLRRRVRRLTAEMQERDLQHRLELRFGKSRVGKFDQIILWLIVFVLGLLAVEVFFLDDIDPVTGNAVPPPTWLVALDTAACAFFLFEIVVKLIFVRGKWRWFWRHLLVDIIPSIPFALFFHIAVGSTVGARGADKIRIVRAIRLLRIARFARAFGFLSRGIDRLVRKYGDLLNRNIVLYPTKAERRRMQQRRAGLGVRVRRIQARLNRRWRRLLISAPKDQREAVASVRLTKLGAIVADPHPLHHESAKSRASIDRDRTADEALQLLSKVTPEEIEAEMGADFVTRVSRAIRVFASPMLRWLPVLRAYIPSIHKKMSDSEVVAAAAQSSAAELGRQHQRWLWFADLYGIITPAQFVDRVGRAMVKAAFRPAYRLVLFALVVFVAKTLIGLAHVAWLDDLTKKLQGFITVLGSICIVVLGIGWWLRRVAGQATEFLEKSAQAQFLSLTETIKGRHLERDAAIMERRVLAPERMVHGFIEHDVEERFVQGVTDWLIEAQAGETKEWVFSPMETTTLLYRDGIDGALFVSSDTRTTSQLLGNPAIRNLRKMANRFTNRDRRQLMKLDLDRQKSLLRGPYLWFALGCQSIAHGVARLVVDYNRNALPLSQHAAATETEMAKYRHWVAAEGHPEIPDEQTVYVTTQFTALHFLDHDEQRDDAVRLRFGPDVLKRMQRDRRHLLRRTFGTYPLHKLPREERVLNLYRAYSRWLAHGRALLIPLYALRAVGRFVVRFLKWLIRCIQEIRRPSFTVDQEAVEGADYHTALRKIHRMRGPVALQATTMRARFDPEYCGVRLPGADESGFEDRNVEDDLQFLGGDPELERELESERQRISRDMARLSRVLQDRGFDRERVRAAAVAYIADMRGMRSMLSAGDILDEVFQRAAAGELAPFSWWPRWGLRRQFGRFWKTYANGDKDARRAAWRATAHNIDGAADALKRVGAATANGRSAEGEAILADLMRHPERISEQIVTLRAVQTLALIDVLELPRSRLSRRRLRRGRGRSRSHALPALTCRRLCSSSPPRSARFCPAARAPAVVGGDPARVRRARRAPFQLDPLDKLPRWGLAVLAAIQGGKCLDLLIRRPTDVTLGRYIAFFLWPNTLAWNRTFRRREKKGVPIELWRAVPRFGAGLGLLYIGAYYDVEHHAWFLSHCMHVFEIFLCIGGASDLIVGVMGLFGWRVDGFFRDVLRARTVLDFWARFDVMVHIWLKDNVYRPASGTRNPNRGLVAVFFASAMLHEYLFWTAVPHLFGLQTLFFGIQAIAGRLRFGRIITWVVVFTSTTIFMISMNAVVDFHSILLPWIPGR